MRAAATTLIASAAFAGAACGTDDTTDRRPEQPSAERREERSQPKQPARPAPSGRRIFVERCGSCHTLADAGATGTVGPKLDDALKGKDAAFIDQSIVDPNAQVAEGFSEGIMPQDYGEKLDDKQLADLVAYLLQATSR
jgi:mono/diheme cytochrome c family protein